MKKIVLIVLIAIGVIAGAAVALNFLFASGKADVFDAVPSDAALILEFHDPASQIAQLREAALWERLALFSLPKRTDGQVHLLDSLILQNSTNTHITASVHKIASTSFGILYSIKTKEKLDEERIAEQLGVPTKRNFKGNNLFEFANFHNNEPLAVAFKQGLVLASTNPVLVEAALSQLESGNQKLTSEENFNEIRKLANKNKDPKIYLNCEHLPLLLSTILNDGYTQSAKGLTQFADWMVLDYKIMNKSIFFNGYAAATERNKGLYPVPGFFATRPQACCGSSR